jgi:hypothetical protein
MKALIDADVLRYELGFASETGIKAIWGDVDALPPWPYVQNLLHARLATIKYACEADEMQLYITEGRTFRFDLAKTKPYKGTRPSKKPWHFDNLTAHMVHDLNATIVTYLEADDQLAIDHVADEDTIIVSRDKDLRQVPGWLYSWELGMQPSFGPALITTEGHLYLDEKKKIRGTGFPFFCSQILTGDTVDNIPGLPKCGPVGAFNILKECNGTQEYMDAVIDAYREASLDDWEEMLLEQGRLLWMTRRLNADGSPELWQVGQTE